MVIFHFFKIRSQRKKSKNSNVVWKLQGKIESKRKKDYDDKEDDKEKKNGFSALEVQLIKI